MACACKKKAMQVFVWTSEDGQTKVEYPSLMQAKAKVQRKGGSYAPKAG